MFKVSVGDYQLQVQRGSLPHMYDTYRNHAALAEEFDLSRPDGEVCFVSVGGANDWPALVVAQRFEPCGGGLDPAALLVPETAGLFLGAGTRLLAYALDAPRRLWEDVADFGFWGWDRVGDVVLMSAELELAAWDTAGTKRWTTLVEPPWGYRVEGGTVHLDVMGRESQFPLAAGPNH
jgi:hypothetical protein